MFRFNKFIVYDGEILLGKVGRHKELLPENYDRNLIRGGGWYHINNTDKTIEVYNESTDFGKFQDDIVELKVNRRILEDYIVVIISDVEGFKKEPIGTRFY